MYDVSIFHSSCFHTVHVLILLHDARYFLPVVPVCFVMKLSWGGACSRTASATNAQTGTKMVLRMRKPCWQWEWSNTAWKKKKCWIRVIIANTIDARKTAQTSGMSCMKSLVCRIPDHEKNIYIVTCNRRPCIYNIYMQKDLQKYTIGLKAAAIIHQVHYIFFSFMASMPIMLCWQVLLEA